MIAYMRGSADDSVIEYGVQDAAAAIRDGVTTSTDLVEGCLARIAATDDRLKA